MYHDGLPVSTEVWGYNRRPAHRKVVNTFSSEGRRGCAPFSRRCLGLGILGHDSGLRDRLPLLRVSSGIQEVATLPMSVPLMPRNEGCLEDERSEVEIRGS